MIDGALIVDPLAMEILSEPILSWRLSFGAEFAWIYTI